MNSLGRQKLYDFLKTHGYPVDAPSQMDYHSAGSYEWLRNDHFDICAFDGKVLYVAVNELRSDGVMYEVEYTAFDHAGKVFYQKKGGHQ